MNFDFTEDQRTIKATARELLASRSPFERVRAAAEAGRDDDALWERAARRWAGRASPSAEEHGGQGLGAVELAVLLEELGYARGGRRRCSARRWPRSRSSTPAPPQQRARWLPGLAAGELTGAFGGGRRR